MCLLSALLLPALPAGLTNLVILTDTEFLKPSVWALDLVGMLSCDYIDPSSLQGTPLGGLEWTLFSPLLTVVIHSHCSVVCAGHAAGEGGAMGLCFSILRKQDALKAQPSESCDPPSTTLSAPHYGTSETQCLKPHLPGKASSLSLPLRMDPRSLASLAACRGLNVKRPP